MNPKTDSHADEQAALWAARLDGSELDLAARRELETWLKADPAHRALLTQYCQFSADLEQQLPLLEGNRDRSAETPETRETARSHPWSHRPRWAGAMLTAAAAVLLVALWTLRPTPAPLQSVATAAAHRQALTLADGTVVELNAQTNLRFLITDKERLVRLAAGEAFFSVHKDASRPFVIETPSGSVRVTGTQFNVRTDSTGVLEVAVAEGSVLVRPGQADAPASLTAAQLFTGTAGGNSLRTLSPAELSDLLAWRQGQAVFTGTPLTEALARFARYHGRGFTASGETAGLRLGGRYSLDDLEGFCSALEEVLPVRVTRDLNGNLLVSRRQTR